MKLRHIFILLIVMIPLFLHSQDPQEIKDLEDKLALLEDKINVLDNLNIGNKINELNTLKNEIVKLKEPKEEYLKKLATHNQLISTFNVLTQIFIALIMIISILFVYRSHEFKKKAEKEIDEIKDLRKELKEEIREIRKGTDDLISSKLDSYIDKTINERFRDIQDRFDNFRNNMVVRPGLHLDRLVQGNQEYDRGNYELAEIYFKEEKLKNQRHINAWVGLARTYFAQGKSQEALENIEEALRLDKENPRFNNSGQISAIKAEILMDLEKYKEAKETWQKVFKIAPYFKKAQRGLDECKRIIKEKSSLKLGKKKKEK